MKKIQHAPINLKPFKEAHLIQSTGKSSDGLHFNSIGKLNQAAWLGERAIQLINEIEVLRDAFNLLQDAVRLVNEDVIRVRDSDKEQLLSWLEEAQSAISAVNQIRGGGQ